CAPSAARTRSETMTTTAPRTDSTRAIVAPSMLRTPRRRMPLTFGIPYWVFTGALALIFLYPLIWTAVSSVSPLAGTSQTDGWGFGNYVSLTKYQAGIWVYLWNS